MASCEYRLAVIDADRLGSHRLALLQRNCTAGDFEKRHDHPEGLFISPKVKVVAITRNNPHRFAAFASFVISVDGVEILSMATAPTERRRGLGTKLIRHLADSYPTEKIWFSKERVKYGSEFFEKVGFRSTYYNPSRYNLARDVFDEHSPSSKTLTGVAWEGGGSEQVDNPGCIPEQLQPEEWDDLLDSLFQS